MKSGIYFGTVPYWVGESGDFAGQLIGRRILYKDTRSKPLGCEAGPPVCHYEYPVYRGLEYRLVVSMKEQPQQEEEGISVKQPDVATDHEYESERSRLQPTFGTASASRKEKLDSWHSYFTGGKRTSDFVQVIVDEASVIGWAHLTSVLSDYLASAAFSAAGLKYQSPIPKLPKLFIAHILQHLNLIH